MSKRFKSAELPSNSLARMPSRIGTASIISRFTLAEKPKAPRLQRFARFTRHAPRILRSQQTDLKIRTSVADLVMKELDAYNRCIFYQRVYILTKNIVLTVEADSSMESILSKYMQSKTSLTSFEAPIEAEVEEVPICETEMEELSHQLNETEIALQIEAKSSQEEYRESLFKLTRADIEGPPKEKHFQELNFFDQFKSRLEEIVKQVEADQLSEDKLSGLLLCMGNSHSLIMIEGTEDTIANFCQELLNISNEYFENMRVFMVEDRIEETYFDEFIYRRATAMNTTEKFPPPTANDPFLMGPQHWLIKEKLNTICRRLSYELKPPVLSEIMETGPQPTIVIMEEPKKEPKKRRIIKRKKSPKPKKEKPKQVSVHAVDVKSRPRDGSGDQASILSDTKLSVASGGSMPRTSQVELETAEVVVEAEEIPEAVSTTAAEAPPANEDEETTLGKVSSAGKLTTYVSSMIERDATTALGEDEDLEPREILSEFAVSPAIYNRLLPEVQRIDLVLSSKRFYLDVAEFVRFSQQIPMQADEDAPMWPTHYNFMPLNVFQRMPFDVNLTFGNYDVKEDIEESSSEDEEKEAGEEGGEK